jgi:hypothetical protein
LSGYDLFTLKINKEERPIIGIKYLAQLFNALLLKGYLQAQWKVGEVNFILKPGKSLII